MTQPSVWWAALLGLGLGLGLFLLALGVPLSRQIDLSDRIEPYLDQRPKPSRLLADPLTPVRLGAVFSPAVGAVAGRLDRWIGGRVSVSARLQKAGLLDDVDGFRIQQVLWGCGCALGVVGLGSLLWWTRGVSLAGLTVVVLCAAVGGVMLRDQVLSRAAATRERRIMAEFPAVAELLALSVTAGEGTTQALERVARLSRGDLSAELHTCLGQVHTGTPLSTALRDLGTRLAMPAITRFVDGMVVAIERGTPLGEILRAQAQDAREAARQALIEQGGKREIAMMVPVVFLVLPVTVLFAVYPGITLLRLSV